MPPRKKATAAPPQTPIPPSSIVTRSGGSSSMSGASTVIDSSGSSASTTSGSASAASLSFAGLSTSSTAPLPGPSAPTVSGGPSASVLGKRKERSEESSHGELFEALDKYQRCLTSLYAYVGMKGLSVEQTALLLDIKRLEKQLCLAKVQMLRILSGVCAAYRDSANADFERIQEQIDVNIALSDSLQEDVNVAREGHGKAVVFEGEQDSDDDDWDSAAEASSTVGRDASSVAGEPSSSVAGDTLSSASQEV